MASKLLTLLHRAAPCGISFFRRRDFDTATEMDRLFCWWWSDRFTRDIHLPAEIAIPSFHPHPNLRSSLLAGRPNQSQGLPLRWRRAGYPRAAEPIDQRVTPTRAKPFGDIHPLAIYRCNKLVLTLILLGKLEEAHQILAANWRLNAPPHANTTPRIAFLRHLIALLESQPYTRLEFRVHAASGFGVPASAGWDAPDRLKAELPTSPARNFLWLATWPSSGTSPTSSSS